MAKALAAVVALFVCAGTAHTGQKADFVLVIKSESRLYLMREGETFASFHVSFGSNPEGHKQKQDDGRTPEGRYVLDFKNVHSRYYKSIHISYPNAKDREEARKRGVDPGGNIMIHGRRDGWEWLSPIAQFFDWTNGCIALSNRDMDAVWAAVDAGTPIEIKP